MLAVVELAVYYTGCRNTLLFMSKRQDVAREAGGHVRNLHNALLAGKILLYAIKISLNPRPHPAFHAWESLGMRLHKK